MRVCVFFIVRRRSRNDGLIFNVGGNFWLQIV
jgi:hypothetical protein